MYETVVAIDLETTGPDAYSDRIIEVGAAVIRNGEVVERFAELAATDAPLAPGIIKLTGITPEMLEGARSLDAVLADFLSFLPRDALCIAHNASFERSFLRAATKDRFKHKVLDTVELSRICFPFLQSHSLDMLAETLELTRPEAHRALGDCETLAALWNRIVDQAVKIPRPVVSEMNFLLASNPRHPYRDFFRRVETHQRSTVFDAAVESIERVVGTPQQGTAPLREIDDDEPPPELDVEGVANLFADGGPFALAMTNYEPREGQLEMARAVVTAFNESKHLLVEAGTGIGKSLAYLVPAAILSTTTDRPVVVSTNTKNLQAQLFEKDLPLLRDVLDIDLKAAIIKGRRNYLCLRKLLFLLRQAGTELDHEERMRMLNVLPWASWSDTGDIAENIVSGRPGFAALWAKLSTIGEDCMGRACSHFRRCFLRGARARALNADIVVANHSLVFAEMNIKSPALPEYRYLIFDEAHNLESAATQHLAIEVSTHRLGPALGRLYRSGKRGMGTGLLPTMTRILTGDNVRAAESLVDLALGRIDEAIDALKRTTPAIKGFFGSLETLLASRRESGSSMRFTNQKRSPDNWAPLDDSRRSLLSVVGAVMHTCTELRETLKEMEPGSVPGLAEMLRDLDASVTWLREVAEDIEFVMDGSNQDYVYWIERASPRAGSARAYAAPIRVGPLLHDQVYSRKRSVIFSSATLTVKGSFDFLSQRLGVDLIDEAKLITLDAGTPFDYPSQCRVLVPMFLPEPTDRGRDYTQELAILLAEVFRRTQGRAMALFTSYDMLRRSAEQMQSELLGDGIRVLAQGLSGSRENMTATFRRELRSVLLGTHSFWEGVDVQGETLSCLAIARLPFAVFTDPIIQARCEQIEAEGGNAFIRYSLPSAVIRFRQGFGRLIRHKSDCGIVIVTDRRIIAKRYGRWFQDSLPTQTETFTNREEFLDEIEGFLPDDPDAKAQA